MAVSVGERANPRRWHAGYYDPYLLLTQPHADKPLTPLSIHTPHLKGTFCVRVFKRELLSWMLRRCFPRCPCWPCWLWRFKRKHCGRRRSCRVSVNTLKASFTGHLARYSLDYLRYSIWEHVAFAPITHLHQCPHVFYYFFFFSCLLVIKMKKCVPTIPLS